MIEVEWLRGVADEDIKGGKGGGVGDEGEERPDGGFGWEREGCRARWVTQTDAHGYTREVHHC